MFVKRKYKGINKQSKINWRRLVDENYVMVFIEKMTKGINKDLFILENGTKMTEEVKQTAKIIIGVASEQKKEKRLGGGTRKFSIALRQNGKP